MLRETPAALRSDHSLLHKRFALITSLLHKRFALASARSPACVVHCCSNCIPLHAARRIGKTDSCPWRPAAHKFGTLPPRVGLWSDADMSNAIVVLSSPRTPDGAESVAAVTSLPLHSAQSCFSVRETDCGEQGAAIGFSMAATVYSHRLPFLRTNAPCQRSRQSMTKPRILP